MRDIVVTRLARHAAEGLIDGQPFTFRQDGDGWRVGIGPWEQWRHHPDWSTHDVIGFIERAADGWRDYQGRLGEVRA